MESDKKTKYTFEQLLSIEDVFKPDWEKIFSSIKNLHNPSSILELIDKKQFLEPDSRTIREDMRAENFEEKYIATVQNFKRTLSNNEARPLYNDRREVRKLKIEKCQLQKKKEDLKQELFMLKYQIECHEMLTPDQPQTVQPRSVGKISNHA